jgi:streptogramin lyase
MRQLKLEPQRSPAVLAAIAFTSALTLVTLFGGAARAATPTVTEFDDGIAGQGEMYGITPASDGRIWFTSFGPAHDTIAAINPANPSAGVAPFPSSSSDPWGVTNGPDGNVFFGTRFNSVGELVPGTGANLATFLGNGNFIRPFGSVAGPDGNIWVTGAGQQAAPAPPANDKVGVASPGVPPSYINEALLPPTADPIGIAVGRSDASGAGFPSLWVPEFGGNRIARVAPTAPNLDVKEYPTLPNPNSQPYMIALGPDGNLWFTEYGNGTGNRVGRFSPPGSYNDPLLGFVEFELPAGSGPQDIAAGPDGNMWITATSRGSILRMNMAGEVTGEFDTPSRFPNGIAPGSDGNLWFTTFDGNQVGRITTALDPPAFQNTSQVAVPNTGASGIGAPYPSNVPVSGLQGTVTGVTVRLTGISHTFPDDLDILLQGPQGHSVMLASDVGSPAGTTSYPADGITLNFSDSAARLLSDTEPLVSGFYRPTNRAPSESQTELSTPAPPPPYGSALSAFNGTNPNGTWKLFAIDDATHAAPNTNRGRIFGGWGLDITTTGPPPASAPVANTTAPTPATSTAVKKCKKKRKKRSAAAAKKCKRKKKKK